MAELQVEPSSNGTQNGKQHLRGKAKGELNWWQELLACITLGLLLSMYYIIVALSILLILVTIFSRSLRPYAAAAFVVFWSSAFWPIKLRQWDAFCNSSLFWLWREYFYYEWLIEEPLTPGKNYLFAEMPHGVFPFGEFISISITNFVHPGAIVASIAASVLFRLPVLRYIFAWIGCRPASAKNIAKIFNSGCSCAITVGGVAEMFLVGGEAERLYLKNHKGFIREALKNGSDLVPVFCFGNSKLLSVVGENNEAHMGFLSSVSRKLKTSILIFYGRWGLPIPYRLPLKFVVGKPIPVKLVSQPTEEDISGLQKAFFKSLEEMYYKHRPAWETRPLSIE